jgi:4-alpha-glucanotransferase
MAIKDAHDMRPWVEWEDKDLIAYKPAALAKARVTYAEKVRFYMFCQFMFYKQWSALRKYAALKNIQLVGDIPIFVAHDSSDVWGNQHLFYLEPDGNPTVIAGVPPDYFSETGQRWGNPLYRWDVMKENNYAWWIARLKGVFKTVDRVRIDHFRGFDAYWEIPAEEETAINGKWIDGPGAHFFEVIEEELGHLPIIAEDLGVITPTVEALRDGFNLPGMQVLQFAFDGSCGSNTFLPHHYPANTVVYTGTHDNNTTLGWWQSEEAHDGIKDCVAQYTGRTREQLDGNIHWELIRLALGSVAETAIIPFQDVLGYGAEARMNTPGKQADNWGWRFSEAEFENPVRDGLRYFTNLYSRGRETEKERINY